MELPLLPLRGVLVFPFLVVPLDIGRPPSLEALSAAMLEKRQLLVVAQKDAQLDDPGREDLYSVGVVADVKQVLRMPNGTAKVVVEGLSRARIIRWLDDIDAPCYRVDVEMWPEPTDLQHTEALVESVSGLFETYIKNSRHMAPDAAVALTVDDPGRLADTITATVDFRLEDKQAVLESLDLQERLLRVRDLLSEQIDMLEMERRVHVRVRRQIERTQKEYYLREQMKAIQRELGERTDDTASEVVQLREQLAKKPLPDAVRDKIARELDRLAKMPLMAAEAVVVRGYVDWVLALPWEETTEDRVAVREASDILEAQHFGLLRVKERILEYLAVRQLAPNLRGPILCLQGPPGVGKTSLARSIAEATNRRFVRVSLGGVRDEAEIRGHRRTYVGAMPGRIVQGMRQAGTKNPVFLLDELDKMAVDFRGDPAAALLEVLDPEQNVHFSDHYLEVDYDLSRVMFITTANLLHQVPRPLLDRLEVIPIPGYSEEEKFHIARRHLWPKNLANHGLEADDVALSDQALVLLIREYVHEAGVRQLERELSAVLRKVARLVVDGHSKPVRVTRRDVRRFLGPPRLRRPEADLRAQIGVATGLSVTEAGGEVMPVEVTVMPGKGALELTGQLGEVMRESARAGYSFLRAHAGEWGLPASFPDGLDIHIHVPEGAIPKEGPSAGVTLATAMASALSRRPVRADVAMTGEVTLRGRVLAVGGIREKVLAAHRAGIRTVVLPRANLVDVADLPERVRRALTVVPAEHLDEVLRVALSELEADAELGQVPDPPSAPTLSDVPWNAGDLA